MIRRLVLRNFQAHKKLELSFVPGINTIIGATDKGKSAIIRALGWIGVNTPNGSRETRWGAKKMAVSVELSEGVTIMRRRGAGGNRYRIGEQIFKAFGKEVPDEVARVLKLGPLNYQFQHDSPFWLATSAGDVSRQLNRVVDLGIIDSTLANVSSELRQARAVVSVSEQRLDDAKAKAARLEHVNEMVMAFAGLEGLNATRCKIAEQVEALQAVVELVETCEKRARRKELPGFEQLDALLEKLTKVSRRASDLAELIETMETLETTAEEHTGAAVIAEAALRQASKGRCPICGRHSGHDDALHFQETGGAPL